MRRAALVLAIGLAARVASAEWTYRGVCWDADWENRRTAWYGTPEAARRLDAVRAMGFNAVSVTPFVQQDDVRKPDIRFARELEHGLLADLRDALSKGLKVVYKPHIWSNQFWDGSGHWHGTIEMPDEAAWRAWFRNYGEMLVAQARIAEREGAGVFVIGVEYVKTTPRTADWKEVIRAVRAVYTGRLTYAAHGLEEAEGIAFWDDLDFIGINAYFPLASGGRDDPATFRSAWAHAARRMEALSVRHGKPVLITEVGYSSAKGGAERPFEWWKAGTPVDEDVQARCYDAMLTSLRRRPWLAGFFIWKYKIGVTPPEVSREPSEWYFVFQDKKAEKVIRRHLEEFRR